jgi:hypothetical protein
MNASRYEFKLRRPVQALLLALAAGAAHASPNAAVDPFADLAPVPATVQDQDPLRERAPGVSAATSPATAPAAPSPMRNMDARLYKSYGAAALEILAFQVVLNRVDHAFVKPDDYRVSMGSVRRNLHSSWVEDRDPFEINQMGHPYQGSVYFNIARSNGLTFWESLGYAFAGSAVWEVAGETTPPSRNDQITTSFGGSFLGEALYRMANLACWTGAAIRRRCCARPARRWCRRRWNTTARRGMSRRAASLWAGATPATFGRLQLGASNPRRAATSALRWRPSRREVAADFALEYGLPGKAGYTYHKPFDYFLFRARVSNANGLESLDYARPAVRRPVRARRAPARRRRPVRQLRLPVAAAVPGREHRALGGQQCTVVAGRRTSRCRAMPRPASAMSRPARSAPPRPVNTTTVSRRRPCCRFA